jgi:hypothetical protein
MKALIQIVVIHFILLYSSESFCQSPGSCDLQFIYHLVNSGDFEDALYLLNPERCSTFQSNDSAHYLRGMSLYSLKKLLPSAESLIKVKPESEFYYKSQFFAAYNYAHTGYYNEAIQTLNKIEPISEKQVSLKNYEFSGINLLQGNHGIFEESLSIIDSNMYEISESLQNLQKISLDLKNHKSKSPLLAGILSGIIPGAGKFYAGKRGEAVSAFIATAGLGLVTMENYRKNGLNNLNTILFGTAFAFSYAANIYGAVITVNIIETEYRENVKNSILFNLHIPLRNFFDK